MNDDLAERCKLRAVLILAESIDVFSVFILKELRRGGDKRLGRRHAYERDLLAVERDVLMRWKDRLARALVDEVAAVVAAPKLCGKLQVSIHAEVVLVIAGNGEVVVRAVHDADDCRAPGQAADRFALNGIACVHEDDLRVFLLQVMLILRDGGDVDVLRFCQSFGAKRK